MDNFDLKKFVSEKTLLNENAPGYDTRKTGEPLPTLDSVKAAYEAKNAKSLNEAKKSEIDKKLAEIDKAGRISTLEAKIAAIDEAVEAKNNRISMVQEDENLSELIDKKRVKEMQKEIKLLEKSKKLYEKQLDKENGKKTPKKEIVDEYNVEPHDKPDASMDTEMNEDFDSVVDDIMDQGKSREDAERIAGAINAKYVGNYR